MNTEENNQNEEVVEIAEETIEEPVDEADTITISKSEWEKTQQRLGSLKRDNKALRSDTPKEIPKTGGLEESQLDYLDLKGISDEDEVSIISSFVSKTGQTVREALKDEYVQTKLTAIRAEKSTKNATPGATKRGGNQQANTSLAISKFDQTGELPADFEARTAVVNAIASRGGVSKPSWHRG